VEAEVSQYREVDVEIAGRPAKRIATDSPHWIRLSQGEVRDVLSITALRAGLLEVAVRPTDLDGHLPMELHGALRVEPIPPHSPWAAHGGGGSRCMTPVNGVQTEEASRPRASLGRLLHLLADALAAASRGGRFP
jgi:hypothetical protein